MNVSNSNATRSKHGPRGGPELFQRCPETGLVRSCVRAGHAAFPDKICGAKPVSRTIPKVTLKGVTQNAMNGRVRSGKRPLPDKLCVDTLSCARFAPDKALFRTRFAPHGVYGGRLTERHWRETSRRAGERRSSKFLDLRGTVAVRLHRWSWSARLRADVAVREGSSWGVGCFGAPLRARWLDGEVSGSVVRPRKWCAHA